jgi:hypothetical protein
MKTHHTHTVKEHVGLSIFRWRSTIQRTNKKTSQPPAHFGFLRSFFSLNGRQTNLARVIPLTFQQGWCREKTSVFAVVPSFTWNNARRETRGKDSTWNQVSAQCGIATMQLVCSLTSLTLFAQTIFERCMRPHSNSSPNKDQAPLCATGQLRPHCTIRRRNTNLRVHCTPRALYTSPTPVSWKISVSLFLSFVWWPFKFLERTQSWAEEHSSSN